MDFPLYFKNESSKWPKVFLEIDHGCLEFLVHILKENHTVPLKS